MGYLIDALQGRGEKGSSAVLRAQMIRIGWNSFKQHPLLGIGYGCPHLLASREMNFDTYLHNNYIELLAGGGIIGFSIFYSIYIYLFYKLHQYHSIKHYGNGICTILLVLILFMDFGQVSCYSKETYFYFMIFFLLVRELRKKNGETDG